MWNILMCLRHWASAIRFSLSIGAFQCTMHSTLQFTYTCIQCNEINFDRLLFFFHFERVCKFLNMRINSRLASSCCLCFFHLHAVICSHWHPLPWRTERDYKELEWRAKELFANPIACDAHNENETTFRKNRHQLDRHNETHFTTSSFLNYILIKFLLNFLFTRLFMSVGHLFDRDVSYVTPYAYRCHTIANAAILSK